MNRNIFVILLLLSGMVFMSCEPRNPGNNPQTPVEQIPDAEAKPIELGKQLENPYTVEALEAAQRKLVKAGILTEQLNIRTTHRYVRFLPANEEEFDQLVQRTEKEEIELFDFPLDYELSEEGVYFQDPTLPDSTHTWQYTVVPVDYSFPRIKYEMLADLFLMDEEDPNLNLYEVIEDQSLKMTDNWDTEDPLNVGTTPNPNTRAQKWRPEGTIFAMDHQLGYPVPVKGAKVVMRRWFKWSRDFTDANGYFRSPKKFRKKVRYRIKWVTPKYRIRSGFWAPAWTTGPKKKGRWDVTFTGGLRLFYATVHAAAQDFFYDDPFGLSKPNPFPKIKIFAKDGCGTGVNHHIASIIGGPDIKIYRKTPGPSCIEKNTFRVYSTTIHELGHSNQRSLGVNKFIFCSKMVRESWADAVEWAFVTYKYKTQSTDLNLMDTKHPYLFNSTTTSMTTFPIEFPFARIRNAERGFPYSPLFIDMMDNAPNPTPDSSILWKRWRKRSPVIHCSNWRRPWPIKAGRSMPIRTWIIFGIT